MTETMTDATLATISLSDIDVGTRFREDFNEDKLLELTVSIGEHGLISPIALFDKSFSSEPINGESDKDKPYLLLAGERRFRAVNALQHTHIEAKVYTRILEPVEIREIELLENIQRENLTWQEEVALKKEIHELQVAKHGEKIGKDPDAPGVSMTDTASLLGVDRSTVTKDIALAKAMESIPELAAKKTKDEARKYLAKIKKEIALEELRKRQEQKEAKTPEEVLKKSLIDSFIVKDFFEGVKNIPEGTIDFVEVDPPYGVDLKQARMGSEKEASGLDHYNEVPAREYPLFIKKVMVAVHRLMKEHSWGVIWFGPEPWFEEVYKAIISAGFTCKRIPLIWVKPSGQTQQPNYNLANTYEMAFYFRKGSPSIIKQGRSNIYQGGVVSTERRYHPTQRPVSLIQDIIETFCRPGSRCLVPFLGSGTSILAANNAKVQAFGYDLSQQYKDAYVARILNGKPGEFTD